MSETRRATFGDVFNAHQGLCGGQEACAICKTYLFWVNEGGLDDVPVPDGMTIQLDGSVIDASGKVWVEVEPV